MYSFLSPLFLLPGCQTLLSGYFLERQYRTAAIPRHPYHPHKQGQPTAKCSLMDNQKQRSQPEVYFTQPRNPTTGSRAYLRLRTHRCSPLVLFRYRSKAQAGFHSGSLTATLEIRVKKYTFPNKSLSFKGIK